MSAFLSLERLKWTWPSPLKFFDENNTETQLIVTSPALLMFLLFAVVCSTNQRLGLCALSYGSCTQELSRKISMCRGPPLFDDSVVFRRHPCPPPSVQRRWRVRSPHFSGRSGQAKPPSRLTAAGGRPSVCGSLPLVVS